MCSRRRKTYGLAVRALVRADALERAEAVVQRVREDVDLGVVPVDELAVDPDLLHLVDHRDCSASAEIGAGQSRRWHQRRQCVRGNRAGHRVERSRASRHASRAPRRSPPQRDVDGAFAAVVVARGRERRDMLARLALREPRRDLSAQHARRPAMRSPLPWMTRTQRSFRARIVRRNSTSALLRLRRR